MRATGRVIICQTLLVVMGCNMHDPEGSPTPCCPMTIRVEAKTVQGRNQGGDIYCSFGPTVYSSSIFRPTNFGAAYVFRHGIAALEERCVQAVNALEDDPRGRQAFLEQCKWGDAHCGVSGIDIGLASGNRTFGGVECFGDIPDLLPVEAKRLGIPMLRLTASGGSVTVSAWNPEDGRNAATFRFRATLDAESREIAQELGVDEYVVEFAGSCECDPYMAAPEEDCPRDRYE